MASTPPHQPYLPRLRAAEPHALWKLALRSTIMALNLIALGAAAWTLDHAVPFSVNPYIGYFSGAEASPWILLVAGLSLLYCLVCVLVLMLRRPDPRPVHPGVAVGCDLILWLAFIPTALFTTAAILSLARFAQAHASNTATLEDPSAGYYGYYGSSSTDYSGEYILAPNRTWVYNITSVAPASVAPSATAGYGTYFYNSTRHSYQLNTTLPSPPSSSDVTRDCTSAGFPSCAAQDAYINTLWASRTRRYAVAVLAGVAQWANCALHFALFVWACVDTHRQRGVRRQRKVDAVAEKVIADMQARGLITVHAGAGAAQEGQPLMAENRSGAVAAGGGSGGEDGDDEIGVAGPSGRERSQ